MQVSAVATPRDETGREPVPEDYRARQPGASETPTGSDPRYPGRGLGRWGRRAEATAGDSTSTACLSGLLRQAKCRLGDLMKAPAAILSPTHSSIKVIAPRSRAACARSGRSRRGDGHGVSVELRAKWTQSVNRMRGVKATLKRVNPSVRAEAHPEA